MNIKELAKDLYDAALATVDVEHYNDDLDGDGFDAVAEATGKVIDDACEVTDEAADEDEDDEDDTTPLTKAAREGYDTAINSGTKLDK
jgi:hypothetical protein